MGFTNDAGRNPERRQLHRRQRVPAPRLRGGHPRRDDRHRERRARDLRPASAAGPTTRSSSSLRARRRPRYPTSGAARTSSCPGSASAPRSSTPTSAPTRCPAPADCELDLYTTLVTELSSFLQTNGALDFIGHFYQVGNDASAHTLLSGITLAAKGAFVQQPSGKLDLLDRTLVDPNSTSISASSSSGTRTPSCATATRCRTATATG